MDGIDSLLTPQENDISNKLAEAMELFLSLPEYHPDDFQDFKAAIHQAQNIILSRPGFASQFEDLWSFREGDGGRPGGEWYRRYGLDGRPHRYRTIRNDTG